MDAVQIGFIGVGRIGGAMARNLLRAGHQVRAWDTSKQSLAALVKDGAEAASSAEDAFAGDAVISMLPNDEAMFGIFLDEKVLRRSSAPAIHINMATASVHCADKLAEAHKKCGVQYISAPVFGRPEMAAERNLNIMAAGDPAAIDRVQPLLDALSKKTWRVGLVPRQANVVKLAGLCRSGLRGGPPLTSGLVALMFGTRYMATLFGIVFLSHQVGSFLGVWLGGVLFTWTGGYEITWWLGIGLGLVAAVLHLPIRERAVPHPALGAAT